MRRFHDCVSVDDLAASVRVYSTLFGTPPTALQSDYAQWMLAEA